MRSQNEYWLEAVLCNGLKLTSKDKLVAAYLLCLPELNDKHRLCGRRGVEIIARNSGLAIRTVQKSLSRLYYLRIISFSPQGSVAINHPDIWKYND